MSADDTAGIAEVLAEHQRVGGHRDLRVHCSCGWAGEEFIPAPDHTGHPGGLAAHVAAAMENPLRAHPRRCPCRGLRSGPCYVYGKKVAEAHWFEGRGSRSAHEFNTGPICIRCGISKGTADKEAAEDAARDRAEAVGDDHA